MKIEDLYTNAICEDIDRTIIDSIISFIKTDGFNTKSFSLVSVENYVWEFISNNDLNRGFLLFYNPHFVHKPIPQYLLCNGCVCFSFNARTITEAYIQHNKNISNEDYKLLATEYPHTEDGFKKNTKEIASKIGYELFCDVSNYTKEWLQS